MTEIITQVTQVDFRVGPFACLHLTSIWSSFHLSYCTIPCLKAVVETQTLPLVFYACLHTQSLLFNFKVSHRHTHTERQNLQHTQLHLTTRMHKQIKPPSVCHTHKELTFHSYADRSLLHHPPLLFSSKFTGLINRFYVVNMADCLVHCVLYSQGLTVNITVKISVNTLSSYHAESNLTAKLVVFV